MRLLVPVLLITIDTAAALAPPPRRRPARLASKLRALPVVPIEEQIQMIGRLVVAGISGSVLGFERRTTRRNPSTASPVGIRTMRNAARDAVGRVS